GRPDAPAGAAPASPGAQVRRRAGGALPRLQADHVGPLRGAARGGARGQRQAGQDCHVPPQDVGARRSLDGVLATPRTGSGETQGKNTRTLDPRKGGYPMMLKRTSIALVLAALVLGLAAASNYAQDAGLIGQESARRMLQVV